MKYMTELEIKAWEKAVEIAFAKWIFVQPIIKKNAACIDSEEFRSNKPQIVRDKVYEAFGIELQEKDLYIPLAGNMEKILGDAVSIINWNFALLEVKASLSASTAKREWNAPAQNSKNKDRGAALERINASNRANFNWFMEMSKQCHFIMGLQENSGDKFKYHDIKFCSYWPFIDPNVTSPHGEELEAFLEKGVSLPDFSKYIDMLLADAQSFQEDECDKLVAAHQLCRDLMAIKRPPTDPELQKAEEKLIELKNNCDDIEKLNRWNLKNIKVKLVVQDKGTVRTFDTTLPKIKDFLVHLENKPKQNPNPKPPTTKP